MKWLRKRFQLRPGKLIVFLLLGAIINVAVAWGCAWWIQPLPMEAAAALMAGDHLQWIAVARATGFGAERHRIGWLIRPFDPKDAIRSQPVKSVWTGLGSNPTATLPKWSRLRWATPGAAGRIPGVEMEDARGWPMLSMWSCLLETDESISQTQWLLFSGGYEISSEANAQPLSPSNLGNWMTDKRALPLLPMWPGFAINTIFYAGILWLLVAAPLKLRRFIRIKRQRCPGCGYPIGTSPVCTECGAGV